MKFPIRVFSVGVAFACALAGCAAQSPANTQSSLSTSIPSSGSSESQPASGTQTASITFPASDKEKTLFNAAAFKINPFAFSFDCPADWEFKEMAATPPTEALVKEFGDGYGNGPMLAVDVYSIEEIWSGGQCIGLMGYNTFDADTSNALYNVFPYLFYTKDYTFNFTKMYLPVHTTNTTESAITYVDYSASIMRNSDPKYHWAVTFYDKTRHVHVAAEFAKDSISISQLVALCQSMSVADAAPTSSAPPSPVSSAPAASDTQTAAITFPASDKEKTKDNAAIFDIPPFKFSFDCPADWEFKELATAPPTAAIMKDFGSADSPLLLFSDNVWSTEAIWSGGKCIGLMGYNTYEPVPGEEKNPVAILSGIAVGNDYNFNVNTMYLPVHTTDTTESALTYVYYAPSILGTDNPRYHWGLTFYDTARHVYVAVEFAKDAASISQMVALCQSMSIADAAPTSSAGQSGQSVQSGQ